MNRRQIKQEDRKRALVCATELLNIYVAARKSAAEQAIAAVEQREKMEHLAVVDQYDDAISKLVLVREVVDNSVHMARRLGQLSSEQPRQGTPRQRA